MKFKKILIIRFSSIGDIVLTTPIIRAIKDQIPDCELHYLTKKQFHNTLIANPHIDKIHLLQEKLSDTLKLLKGEKFDYIIDLHNNLRTRRVKLSLRIPSSSFNKINIAKWLITKFHINRLPNTHIVDRYFETLKTIQVHNDHKGLEYYIPSSEEIKIQSAFPQIKEDYYTWVIGGQHSTKIFPKEKIANILQQTNKTVLLLGGPMDKEMGDYIQQKCGKNIINTAGNFSLNQSASILKQSQKVFTNDTGLMHIAAAFQKEIISFWGNTIPQFGMYPYKTKHTILEIEDLKCRPCSKIGFQKCPKGHFRCMMDISEKEVLHFF